MSTDSDARTTPSARMILSDQDADLPVAQVFAADGRELFRIQLRPDGQSIEVRSWQTFRANGVLWDSPLSVLPLATNSLIVARLVRWGDGASPKPAKEPRS